MKDDTRARLFFLGCVPVRWGLAFAAAALATDPVGRRWVGAVALVVASGFVGRAVQHPTHGFFGGKVWWTRLRWVHAVLWAAAGGVHLADGVPWAVRAVPLVLDAAVGTVAGVLRR